MFNQTSRSRQLETASDCKAGSGTFVLEWCLRERGMVIDPRANVPPGGGRTFTRHKVVKGLEFQIAGVHHRRMQVRSLQRGRRQPLQRPASFCTVRRHCQRLHAAGTSLLEWTIRSSPTDLRLSIGERDPLGTLVLLTRNCEQANRLPPSGGRDRYHRVSIAELQEMTYAVCAPILSGRPRYPARSSLPCRHPSWRVRLREIPSRVRRRRVCGAWRAM